MRRSLVYMLIVVALAAWLGALISREPGYVLLAYGDYSLQTSLWMLVCFVAVAAFLVHVLMRLLRLVFKAPLMVNNWRSDRRLQQSGHLTARGLILFLEGEFERARKYLDGGEGDSIAKGISYFAAAKAADDAGDSEARETYLRMSEESDASLAAARQVTAAELALQRGDYEGCLRALDAMKDNAHVLRLRQVALRKLGDGEGMLKLVPRLAKNSREDALQYEVEAASRGFGKAQGDDEALRRLYKSLSAEARKSPPVLLGYANALGDKAQAESLLRGAIRKSWDESLVAAYGELPESALPESALKARARNVQAWEKHHGDSPALQYCLGLIHESAGDRDKAKAAYARSVEAGGVEAAQLRLAALREGD